MRRLEVECFINILRYYLEIAFKNLRLGDGGFRWPWGKTVPSNLVLSAPLGINYKKRGSSLVGHATPDRTPGPDVDLRPVFLRHLAPSVFVSRARPAADEHSGLHPTCRPLGPRTRDPPSRPAPWPRPSLGVHGGRRDSPSQSPICPQGGLRDGRCPHHRGETPRV